MPASVKVKLKSGLPSKSEEILIQSKISGKMEWPLNDPSFSTHNLDRVFVYEPRPNQGVYQFVGDEVGL